MKKVVLAFLFLILGILIYPSYRLIDLSKENIRLKALITSLKKDNETINKSNSKHESEIEALKEEKKDKWEELQVWEETKEKINKALSS